MKVHGLSKRHRALGHARGQFARLLEAEKDHRLAGQPVPAKLKQHIKIASAAITAAEALDGLVPCFKCGGGVDLEGSVGETVSIRQRYPLATQQLTVYGHLDFGKDIVLCAVCSVALTDYLKGNEEEIDLFT